MISQFFSQNHGYFALGSQNIKPKKAKKPNKIFDASKASLHGTSVCRSTLMCRERN